MQRNCRRCGGRGIPIVMGMPDGEMVERAARGEIVLDGCIGDQRNARRQCAVCEFRWGGMPFDALEVFELFATTAVVQPFAIVEKLDDRFEPFEPASALMSLAPVRRDANDGSWITSRNSDFVRQLILGDPSLVVLTTWSDGLIEVDEFGVGAASTGVPISGRRGDPLFVPPLELIGDPEQRSSILVRLVTDAGRRRAARFRRCTTCGVRQPPEDMHDQHTCALCELRAAVRRRSCRRDLCGG